MQSQLGFHGVFEYPTTTKSFQVEKKNHTVKLVKLTRTSLYISTNFFTIGTMILNLVKHHTGFYTFIFKYIYTHLPTTL